MDHIDSAMTNGEVVKGVSDEKFIYVHDMRSGVTAWTQEAMEFFNLPEYIMSNTTAMMKVLIHAEDFARWQLELTDVLSLKKEEFFCSFRVKNADGEYVPCVQKGKMVMSEEGEPVIFTGTLAIEQREIQQDVITELPKVSQFIEDVREAKRHGECLIMAIDIRRFQNVNTVYGYDFGSKTLYEIAKAMVHALGDRGQVYRREGTEFLVIIDNADVSYAKDYYVTIRDSFSKFKVEGIPLNLEMYGGALYTKNSEISTQAIFSCLMSALEKAREEEASELVVFDDESHQDHYKMMELLDTIKNAIREDCQGFYLRYQPFVSSITGKVIGAEALLRFRNEKYGEVSPGRFVPHLESHSSFYDLSMWILRQAIADAKEILKMNPSFFINVNISYCQLERETFKDDVVAILNELDFPKRNLQLEITERCRNMNLNYLKEQLTYLRAEGIKVALDDFGTGSCTINLLCELPITSVKIDQSFILHILENTNNQIVVDSTVQCAKRLGLSVCMEGVETQEIKDFIGRYSANYHQGYFYSRPVEFARFKEIMATIWPVPPVSLIKTNPKKTFGAENILSMMPGGFFIYANNETEKLLTVNQTLLDIFECTTLDEFLELTNSSFKGIVHPDDYESVSNSIVEQIEKNTSKMDFVRYRITTKSGKVKNVRDYGRLVHNVGDEDVYYVFLVEDHD